MKRKRLQFVLALLVTAATGAWAQSTTHVVTQSTVDDIFSGDGYTLGDDVKEGDVLDFQGTIELEGEASHSLVINKQVTVISSTKDAVIKLHTVAGFFMDNTLGSRFIINKAGSGTKVQGIRIENTETWLYNTSNVTFTGVTMSVEDALVGSGKGHVSIRYSDHVTFDGCTVFTRNNGGSTCFVLTGSSNCTFKNSSFQSAGNTGTIFYLSPSNVGDMPEGFPTENNIPMSNDNSVLNCTFSHEESTATRNILISFYRNRLEGCKMTNVSIGIASGGIDPKSPEQGCIYRNNTVNGPNGLTLLAYSTAVGNTVTGSVTLNQGATATNNTITGKVTVKKGSTVTGNTINGNVTVSANSSDYTGSTITGNTINGTVTFATNSKNNTLTRNVITSTGSYAVVMASTADANNTVQYNTLIAATKKGDEAVNPSTGSGNTISYNSNIALMLADGTKDAANWTATVGTSTTANPLPVGGLNEGDAVTMKYNGRLKVKSVTATHDGENVDETTVKITTSDISEGDASVVFNVQLSKAPQGEATVQVKVGETTFDVAVDASGKGVLTLDNANDDDPYLDASTITAEVVGVTGGNYENVVTGQKATAIIRDTINDAFVSITGNNFHEGDASVVFNVFFSNATLGEAIVQVQVGNTIHNVIFSAGILTETLTLDNPHTSSVTAEIVEVTGGFFENIVIVGQKATAYLE